MNDSYYQGGAPDAAMNTSMNNSTNVGNSYQSNSSGYQPNSNGYQPNSNSYQPNSGDPVTSSPADGTTNPDCTPNKQGEATETEGDGPDFICKWLDKLERKFGGERFNNPDNDAKNAAMNQKMSDRIKKVGPMVLKKLPQLVMSLAR